MEQTKTNKIKLRLNLDYVYPTIIEEGFSTPSS